ncbi:hypothetical protein HDU84_000889, partial [Entophlyctis sp. JEL0112]
MPTVDVEASFDRTQTPSDNTHTHFLDGTSCPSRTNLSLVGHASKALAAPSTSSDSIDSVTENLLDPEMCSERAEADLNVQARTRPGKPSSRKLNHFEGLRVICTIICFHLKWPDGTMLSNSPWSAWIINGPFVIRVFFILSGRLLVDGYFATVLRVPSFTAQQEGQAGKNHVNKIVSAAVRRPFRLGGPFITMMFLIWLFDSVTGLILKAEKMAVDEFIPLFPDSRLRILQHLGAHIAKLRWYELPAWSLSNFINGDIFTEWESLTATYASLWTVPVEFRASYIAFLAAAVIGCVNNGRMKIMLAIFLLTYIRDPVLNCFVIGVIICYANNAGVFEEYHERTSFA